MYAPEVFVFWSYAKIPLDDFLSFSSASTRLYAAANRMVKEVSTYRNLKRKNRFLTKAGMFREIGDWCSLYMAKQLLGNAFVNTYTPVHFSMLRPFMENPNLGLHYVKASPSDIVSYYLNYKKCPDDFSDANFRQACQNIGNSKYVWKYIRSAQALKYCLNHFPEHVPDIVNGALTGLCFRPSFLTVIDNYKDNLYSPLQKKRAIQVRKRNRREQLPPPCVYGTGAADLVQGEIDKANDTTKFLLRKRNKCK
jgi:hypothetical protein